MSASHAFAAVFLLFTLLFLLAFWVLWNTKAWGRPNPQNISDERLSWCTYDIERWIQKYNEQPSKQKDKRAEVLHRNIIYWRELRLESLKRSTAQSGMDDQYRGRALNKYIPIDTRAIELMKSGLSEWEADKQAYDEWIERNSYIRLKN